MDFFTPLTDEEIAEAQKYVSTHELDHEYDDWFDGVPEEQEMLRSCITALQAIGKMPE